jgi:hypothetical protein
MRRFPRPRNPRNIKRYIYSPKPLYGTRYTIFKSFLITYIELSGLDFDVRELGFDGGGGREEKWEIEISECEACDAVFCEGEGGRLSDSWERV